MATTFFETPVETFYMVLPWSFKNEFLYNLVYAILFVLSDKSYNALEYFTLYLQFIQSFLQLGR